MTLRSQRLLCLATVLWTGLALAASPAAASLEEEMLEAVRSLRSGTLSPEATAESCVAAIEASDKEADYRAVMTTFLDVPGSDAIPALCRAIVRSIVAGTITEDNLAPVLSGTPKDREAAEAGRLLRSVYFAHHLGSALPERPEAGQ